MNRSAVAIAGTRGGPLIPFSPAKKIKINSDEDCKFLEFYEFTICEISIPMARRTLSKGRIFTNFSKGNVRIRRVPIARRMRSLNVALTMNPLVIFSSLVPDGQEAWLSGGFSARVFYVQRR